MSNGKSDNHFLIIGIYIISYNAIGLPAGVTLRAGANLLDFTARTYDPSILLFHTPDPLRDKYLSVHAHLYCGADPVNRIDPTGCGDFWDGGKMLGNDGKLDGKVFVLKTKEKVFNSDGESVPCAGLSKKDRKATIEFIEKNSGKSEVFTTECLAYTNCIEIESSKKTRDGMLSAISEDNGKGGRSDDNNREHGGYIEEDGTIVKVPSGDVCDLSTDTYAYISMPINNRTTFHSHPSGEYLIEVQASGAISTGNPHSNGPTNRNKRFYYQFPSSEDIKAAGEMTHYVFGKSNSKVYVYNSSGVQAVIKLTDFLKY